ncbi:MAG: URC4/urg3 family protein [Burkholderiaceae bacterium]|nr:URC4/urg3 family protein [Burkholderiaceae bacterium]
MVEAVRLLRKPSVVRERCANITAAVAADRSPHFRLDRTRLGEVVRRVARLTQERFAGGQVPLHSRWRHFEAGGVDRKALLDVRIADLSTAEQARTRIDLAVVSVLLDAGAGPDWRFSEPGTGRAYARSEGLALASFHAFVGGAFSSDLRVPMRVDADALERLDATQLARHFQVRDDNPLVGLDGRVALLKRLGAALKKRPDVFGSPGRPGYLFDLLTHPMVGAPGSTIQRIAVKRVSAAQILRTLLKAFGGIWPSGQLLAGRPVGDTWPHPMAGGEGASAGRVPFHKLSQWLAYSLVEPFEWAGIAVEGLDELTGLPEYRNGGLLIDAGVIVPRDPAFAAHAYTVADPWIIEWRALTVTLLDEVARGVRAELGKPALPLAAILEGGTWLAGRQIAQERRPGGPPPVRVASNGTIF